MCVELIFDLPNVKPQTKNFHNQSWTGIDEYSLKFDGDYFVKWKINASRKILL